MLSRDESGSKKLVSWRTAAVAIALVVLGSGVVALLPNSAAKAGGSKSLLDDGAAFDPSLAALGIDEQAELEELKQKQADLAVDLKVKPTEAKSTKATKKPLPPAPAVEAKKNAVGAWNVALDDLYVRVSRRPEAVAFRAEWLSCMGSHGISLTTRSDLESLITAPENTDARVIELSTASDTCDAAQVPALGDLLRAEFPRWRAAHADTIAAYRAALEL